MKKFLLAIFAVVAVQSAMAQTSTQYYLSTDFRGVALNGEFPLGRRSTLIASVGSSSAWDFNAYNDRLYITCQSMTAYFGAQFRWYYNIGRRLSNGRNTSGNSANFWALDLTYRPYLRTDELYSRDVYLTPYWGIRRCFGYYRSWMFEMLIGPAVSYYNDSQTISINLDANISIGFGYRF